MTCPPGGWRQWFPQFLTAVPGTPEQQAHDDAGETGGTL
jgi:hypothetical protein